MSTKRMVIDFHVHMIPYASQSPSLDELMVSTFGSMEKVMEFSASYSKPESFVQLMRAEGVDYAVILAEDTPLTTGICSHEKVSEFCAGHKELIPFCTINPFSDPNPRATLRNLHALGYKGVKLYPTYNHFYINEPRMYPVYEVATELNLPILIHTGSSVFKNSRLKYGNPIDVDDVAVDFPDLSLVLAHGGRGAWYAEAMTVTRLHKNVYIDVTGLPVRKLLGFFPDMERFSEKFIFGTDWPQVSAKKSIETFQQLGLSEKALENILGGNAAKLLGLRG